MLSIIMAAALAASAADFCILSAEERGNSLGIIARDGALKGRVEIGKWPHEVEASPDGRTAYVSQFGITEYDSRIGTPGDHVSRIDLATGRETARYLLPEGLGGPHGVKLRPGTGELFVNTESGGNMMLVYDAVSQRLERRFALRRGSHNFIFSADGRFLYVFAGSEGVAKYDSITGKLLVQRKLATPVRGLRLTSEGRIAAAAKGEVAILDPGDLAVRRRLPSPVRGQLVYLETLRDGTIVAPSMTDDGVAWFEPGKRARFIRTGKGALNVRAAPDGNLYIANVDDDHLTVLSSHGDVLRQVGKDIPGPNGLAFGACPAAAAGER